MTNVTHTQSACFFNPRDMDFNNRSVTQTHTHKIKECPPEHARHVSPSKELQNLQRAYNLADKVTSAAALTAITMGRPMAAGSMLSTLASTTALIYGVGKSKEYTNNTAYRAAARATMGVAKEVLTKGLSPASITTGVIRGAGYSLTSSASESQPTNSTESYVAKTLGAYATELVNAGAACLYDRKGCKAAVKSALIFATLLAVV